MGRLCGGDGIIMCAIMTEWDTLKLTSCEIAYDPGLVKCKQKLGEATESINVRVAHGVNMQLQCTIIT